MIDVSVKVNCHNWPIIGYTRSWHTEMKYRKQCLITSSLPSPHPVLAQIFSIRFRHYPGAWYRLLESCLTVLIILIVELPLFTLYQFLMSGVRKTLWHWAITWLLTCNRARNMSSKFKYCCWECNQGPSRTPSKSKQHQSVSSLSLCIWSVHIQGVRAKRSKWPTSLPGSSLLNFHHSTMSL